MYEISEKSFSVTIKMLHLIIVNQPQVRLDKKSLKAKTIVFIYNDKHIHTFCF